MGVGGIQRSIIESPFSRSEARAGAYLSEIAARALERASVSALALPCGPLPDSKQTWILRDGSGAACAAAQLSPPRAPGMVARGVARAASIRAMLDAPCAAPVLAPFATGSFEGASYAIWPFCEPASHRRSVRSVFMRPLLDWVRELAHQTAQPIALDALALRIDPSLCRMATNVRLSTHARLAARDALRRLDSGRFRPMHVAMHGDLHFGNVVIDDSDVTGRGTLPIGNRFAVIDWCGASRHGYPMFDLLRIADSMRVSDSRLARELSVHCALLGGDLGDSIAHTAVGLADLGVHLEHFPVAAYSALVDRVLARLDRALIHNGAQS
jgi:hypothetical protein